MSTLEERLSILGYNYWRSFLVFGLTSCLEQHGMGPIESKTKRPSFHTQRQLYAFCSVRSDYRRCGSLYSSQEMHFARWMLCSRDNAWRVFPHEDCHGCGVGRDPVAMRHDATLFYTLTRQRNRPALVHPPLDQHDVPPSETQAQGIR